MSLSQSVRVDSASLALMGNDLLCAHTEAWPAASASRLYKTRGL